MNVVNDLKKVAYGKTTIPKIIEVQVRAQALKILAKIGFERMKEKAYTN